MPVFEFPHLEPPWSLMENWPSEDSLVREDCLLEKIRITYLTNDKNPGLKGKYIPNFSIESLSP